MSIETPSAHDRGNFENYERGIFGLKSNPEARFIPEYETLERYVEALRTIGLKVVLTSGSFDLLHVGHARYLEKASEYGDVLVVGVDSDAKVRKRKGESRPIVPESERVQMLAHLRPVDILTLKYPDEPKWELIKRLRPDTLIVTKETYDQQTLEEIELWCGRVVVLEPQATTSTSAQIRKLQIGWSENITEPVDSLLAEAAVPEELRRSIAQVLLGRVHHE
jgi:D-beta-D-heptose 7-phosphate kinase/D-beta-D-heptose 1-phosphate adenosyltransferase